MPPEAYSNDYWELNERQEIIGFRNDYPNYKIVENQTTKNQTEGITKKGKKCFNNGNNGMNSSSKDSLISCNSNNNSVTIVTPSNTDNIFVENIPREDNFEDSSGNDIKDSDSIVNENHFESHTFGPSFKLNKNESDINLKNNTFNYKEERTRKYNKHNKKAGSKASSSTASKIPIHSRPVDQEYYNLESTYGKTAGANSSISATNNHRKNLKLRQQNMDHDYRYENLLITVSD